ncbi:acyltransferase [Christiangramia aquimixticola]|uniref:acyltransferase n=1 Tax=Christiangramia aquimixticola TaxID=1697558 RepID=UPI003AA7E58D
MKKNSSIGNFNVFKGPFSIVLEESAIIGKRNKFVRGKRGISYGTSSLSLGRNAIVVSDHHLDLTRSIRFGEDSILAGIRSQLWTHGYVHASKGSGRYRVDGSIDIGKNVYLGSGVLINPGVKIADTINVGGNATISKDLITPGMYVNQPLRLLDKSFETIKSKLKKVDEVGLVEDVYEK